MVSTGSTGRSHTKTFTHWQGLTVLDQISCTLRESAFGNIAGIQIETSCHCRLPLYDKLKDSHSHDCNAAHKLGSQFPLDCESGTQTLHCIQFCSMQLLFALVPCQATQAHTTLLSFVVTTLLCCRASTPSSLACSTVFHNSQAA